MDIRTINKINKNVEEYTGEKIRVEFSYEIRKRKKCSEYFIDLVIQVGSNLHIFEIKTGSNINKAKKQLNFHKKNLIENKEELIRSGKLRNYNKVYAYYISERENIIINLENEESYTLDPTFINNPITYIG